MSRISPGTILLAFLAVLCGLIGVFFAIRPKPVSTPVKADPPITVPVASAELTAGRRITLGDIALIKLTRGQLKQQGITGSFMGNAQQIIGRVLQEPVPAGSPFRPSLLFPEGMGPGIQKDLTPGHRAVTVAVAGNEALLGFATAGSWVDVIFRSEPSESRTRQRPGQWTRLSRTAPLAGAGSREFTITLIERVRVLAIDANTLSAAPDKAIRDNVEDLVSVTLEVSPEQAEKLRVVDGRGQLSLALRSDDDQQVRPEADPRTLDDVLRISEVVKELEVYRGTRFTRITFEREGTQWHASRSPGPEEMAEPETQTAAASAARQR